MTIIRGFAFSTIIRKGGGFGLSTNLKGQRF